MPGTKQRNDPPAHNIDFLVSFPFLAQENKDGNAAAAAAGAAAAAATPASAAGTDVDGRAAAHTPGSVALTTVATGKGGRAGASGPAPYSCLDALCGLLQEWKRLRAAAPSALAKFLQVLAALWQAGPSAQRPLSLLQQQPGLWGCVAGLLAAAAAEGQLTLPAAAAGAEGGDAEAAAAAACWAVQGDAAALLEAEGYALQVAAAECYGWGAGATTAAVRDRGKQGEGGGEGGGAAVGAGASSSTASPGDLPAGLPAELAAFARKVSGSTDGACAPPGVATALLRRYCSALPSLPLVAGLQRAAAAAGLQLLGAALGDEALWLSVGAGEGLLPLLAASAEPLLRQLGSQGEASRLLSEHAEALAARGLAAATASAATAEGQRPPPEAAAADVAAALLRQAEVPERLAPDREVGPAYVYDAAMFGRRAGAALVQEQPLLQVGSCC